MKPLSSASPHAIIMLGIPGSGKTTFAERFADTFQAPFVNQTKLRREFELTDDKAWALRQLILNEYAKTHRTLLIEGGVETKASRAELIKDLAKAGYKPLLVWVQTDTVESRRRALKPYPVGSGISDDEFTETLNAFEVPTQQEQPIVISGKHTYVSQLKIVLKHLATTPTTPVKKPIEKPTSAARSPQRPRTRYIS